jgi:Gamma interferon inducible lysosomal thiol reductase (GILT)
MTMRTPAVALHSLPLTAFCFVVASLAAALLLVLLPHLSSSHQQWRHGEGDDAMAPSALAASSRPVAVAVYVEALCIDSQIYFGNQLMPTYEILGPMVMDLKVIVYGNAKLSNSTSGDAVECQHGKGTYYSMIETSLRLL